MTHGVSEMRVLVRKGRRVSLLLARERSRRLLLHKDFRDKDKAKSLARLLARQGI